MASVKQEAARMKKLAPHRNVVPFYGVCLGKSDLRFCSRLIFFTTVPNFAIVSLYCDGGSLDVLLFESPDDISPERRLSWTKDIAHVMCRFAQSRSFLSCLFLFRRVLLICTTKALYIEILQRETFC